MTYKSNILIYQYTPFFYLNDYISYFLEKKAQKPIPHNAVFGPFYLVNTHA